MKKWLAAMLMLVLLLETLPLSALAATARGGHLTEAELKAAYALTGKNAGAGVYHNGMAVSASMNARQLCDWLEEQLSGDLYSTANHLANARVAIEDARQDDPAAYRQLIQRPGWEAQVARMDEIANEAEDMRQTLRFQRDRLTECIVMVEENGELLEASDVHLYSFEKDRCHAKISDASGDIQQIRRDAVANYARWTADIALWKSIVDGSYDGDSAVDAGINDCISAIFDTAEAPVVVNTAVRVSGNAVTRASRLKKQGSVLANDTTTITVMDSNHIYFELRSSDNKPVQGITLSVRDYVGPEATKQPETVTGTTNEDGFVSFEISKFTVDDDSGNLVLHVEANAKDVTLDGKHFRSFCIPKLQVARGKKYAQTLEEDDLKSPYIYSATFNTLDIMYNNREILHSNLNTEPFEIAVKVAGKNVEPVLYYAEDDAGTNEQKETGTFDATRGVWVFKKEWKTILSPDNAARIYFRFVGSDKKIMTKLKPIWSVFEEPTDLSSVLSGISPGLGWSFKIPWGDDSKWSSSIDFSVSGFDHLMPQFFVDPTGTVYLMLGGTSDQFGDLKVVWKTNELEDWENMLDKAKKDSKLETFKSQLGAAYDKLKQDKYNTNATGGWRFGLFWILTAKWSVDKSDPNAASFALTGCVGVSATYFFELTFQYVTPGPLPIPGYICVTFNAGFTFGVEIGFDWNLRWNDTYWAVYDWNFHFHDFTIGFRIGAELTLGVGFKGLLSFWIKGGGYLDFVLNVFRNRPVAFIITGGASASAGFTFAIFTISATIWSGSWQLYPKDDDDSANYLLNHYMPPARANDDVDHFEPTPQMPASYPSLAPDAELKLSGLKDTQGDVKVCNLGDDMYVFYLQDNRIHWRNVSDGTGKAQGDIVNALKDGQKLYDGDIDVTKMKDYAFDVCVAKGTTQVPDHDLDCNDYFALVGVCADEYDDDGSPIDTTENVCVYAIFLWPDASGKLVCAMNGDSGGQLGYFRSAWAGSDYEDVSFIPNKPVIHQARYQMTIEERDGDFGMWLDDIGVDVELDELQNSLSDEECSMSRLGMTQSLQCAVDGGHSAKKQDVQVTGSDDASHSNEDVACGAGDDYANIFANSFSNGSWISVTRSDDGEGDAGAIEFYDPIMDAAGEGNRKAIVMDEGKIDCYAHTQLPLADGGVADMIFYTENVSTAAEDVNLWRLKGLCAIEQDRGEESGDMKLETTLSSYDITLPVSQFKTVTIRNVVYLYWLAGNSQDSDGTKDTWRVNAVLYDPVTNFMSSPQVLAEFTMPDSDTAIYDLYVTEGGKGYLTSFKTPKLSEEGTNEMKPLSVYEFQTDLHPKLDLKGQVIEDLLVSPGEFDDFTVTVMNSGNMAATSLDVDVVSKESSGDTVVATLHADCQNPENSYMMMDGKKIVEGEKAFYRLEDFDYGPRQNDWLRDETNTEYVTEGGLLKSTNPGDSNRDYVKTDMILPGSMAAFKGAFKIPESWEDKSGKGETKKNIELVLKTYSSNTNWVGALANAQNCNSISVVRNASGIASNAADSRELTWVRDDDTGEMVLKTSGLQSPHSQMVSRRLAPPDSVTVEALHDLEVTGRVYDGPFGERMLEVSVLDLAHTGESIRLYMQVYPDDGDTAYTVGMDHFPDVVSDHMTHTFTMPLSEVLDPETMEKARVVVLSNGLEEATTSNNDFMLYLDGEYSPLILLRQPRDVTIQEGESASFSVQASGGVPPYSYQWQIWDEKHQKWVDIPGYTEATMSREKVEKKWDGCKFRCVVTDRAGNSVTSDAATLTVRDAVDTGDHSSLPLYLAAAFAALALLWWVRRRQRREEKKA